MRLGVPYITHFELSSNKGMNMYMLPVCKFGTFQTSIRFSDAKKSFVQSDLQPLFQLNQFSAGTVFYIVLQKLDFNYSFSTERFSHLVLLTCCCIYFLSNTHFIVVLYRTFIVRTMAIWMDRFSKNFHHIFCELTETDRSEETDVLSQLTWWGGIRPISCFFFYLFNTPWYVCMVYSVINIFFVYQIKVLNFVPAPTTTITENAVERKKEKRKEN